MNFRDYLSVARERWILVVAGALVGLSLGCCFAFLSTPQYAASTKFFISTPDQGRDLNQAYQGSLLSEQKIKSYVDLAGDRRIREQVAAQLGSPVAAGVISASARPDTVLLNLTATNPSPQRAQQIVNLAAKDFADLVAEMEKSGSGQPLVVARQILPANLPIVPVSPRRGADITLGLILGLMVGIGLALARHNLDRTVKSPDTLADLVQAPVLGATQYDPAVRNRPLVVHDQPRAPLAEAFRQLRTNLEYVDLDNTHRLTMVTSALPNEGKTSTACNLAIALAHSGKRVILVEGDLRRPNAATYLGMDNTVGLTTVLTGQVSLELAVQPWRGGLLDFLGAGALPPNPSELLASSRMATLLASLNDRYDAVILDAAPTLPVADAAVLAAHCHGVLFLARHGHVRADQVKAAVETIRRVGTPILGIVLSMAPASRGGGYSYQYGYGYVYTATGRDPKPQTLTPTPDASKPAAPRVPAAPAVPAPRASPLDMAPPRF